MAAANPLPFVIFGYITKYMEQVKHIVCDSGGHSSAIVAIEVVRKFGKENVILLNHQCR